MTEQTFGGMKKGQENKMKAQAAGLVRRLAAPCVLCTLHATMQSMKKDKEPFLNPLSYFTF